MAINTSESMASWSPERERQYEQMKEEMLERVETEGAGEETSSVRNGGFSSHRGGGRTYRQLYQEAKDRGIAGRSAMSKAQLEQALDR
jgi:hypothetical protein